MLKKMVIALVLSFSAATAWAYDDKPAAPKDVVDSIVEQCKQYASEDGVKAEDMDSYVLSCVNDELDDQGYAKVDKL